MKTQLAVQDFGYAAGWRVDQHPRLLAHVTGNFAADIVGFGDAGVRVALNNGDGTFQAPRLVVPDFGYAAGWRVEQHPRFLADVTGDGADDIVGFGDAGVRVALSNGDGTFQTPQLVVPDFGPDDGWRVDKHPRFLADVTGDGTDDIVGFGDAGVWVALNNGNGTFQAPRLVLRDFGPDDGWRVDQHPRLPARLVAKRPADIVGFGDAGVWIALNNGNGTFQTPRMVEPFFGYPAGWRAEKHPRLMHYINGDLFADIVGFGNSGVWVALNKCDGTGTFQAPQLVVRGLGYNDGWRMDQHPRLLAKLTQGHLGRDIVGFGNSGVWVATNNKNGTFQAPQLVLRDFGYNDGWRVDKHPRFCADVTGNGLEDIVGFGDSGVWVASDLQV